MAVPATVATCGEIIPDSHPTITFCVSNAQSNQCFPYTVSIHNVMLLQPFNIHNLIKSISLSLGDWTKNQTDKTTKKGTQELKDMDIAGRKARNSKDCVPSTCTNVAHCPGKHCQFKTSVSL